MKKTAFIFIILAMLLPGASLASSGDRASGAPARPGEKEKCPVCGMFVYKYPDWTAALVLPRGGVLYFDGAKDMFKHLRGATGRAQKVSSAWVTEYYGLSMIEAKKAFYVTGSDIYGPMGHELIPFATRREAEEFMADHKGRRIVTFSEVDMEILRGLK